MCKKEEAVFEIITFEECRFGNNDCWRHGSSFGFGVLVIISGCNVLLTALVYERDHSIKSSDSQEQLNDKIVYYNNFCVGPGRDKGNK